MQNNILENQIESARVGLGPAQFRGLNRLSTLVRHTELTKGDITEPDLQRVLAYYEIRDLSPEDINTSNLSYIQKAISEAGYIF